MTTTIRKLSIEDLPSLSLFLGRTVTKFVGDTLIALDDDGVIVGALSFSRIFSTWEDRSLAVNSAITSSTDILKQLLVALAKAAAEENYSRIDAQTSDSQLAACLGELGSLDLTALEDWNAFELRNLPDFVLRIKK